ncbi:MAG: hypothetical protein ACO2ON_03820 [Candidatus Nanopusillus sp.]
MKIKLKPDKLKTPIESKLKKALEEAKDIKSKIYLSIAYFQYINKLSTNKAIILFKEYVLSDGKKASYPFGIYLLKDNKIVTKYIEIPLKIDEFLLKFMPEIMVHKDLVAKVNRSVYREFIKTHLKINTSDITAYVLYKMITDINIYNLISLRKHWSLFNRNIIPFLLKNKNYQNLT